MSNMADLKAPTTASYVMVATLVLVWGTTFLLIKIALEEASPMIVAAARVIVATLAVVPLAAFAKHQLPKDRARWFGIVALGIFSLSLPFTLLAYAQQVVPSGIVGVYMAVIPLCVLPLAHFFSPGERMTLQKSVGFVIGFCGVLMLLGWETVIAIGSADAIAQLACLATALSYAVGSIITRRTPPMDPILFSALGFVVGSVIILPFGIAAWPEESFSLHVWAILLFIGLISSGLAMVLRVKIITTVGSVFMSTVGYLVPITALTVGILFGGETLGTTDIIACALILSGLAVAQRKKPRKAVP